MSGTTGPISFARRHCAAIAIALSALLAVVYLIWQPQALDLAAQTFRADLWERDGFVIWNPDWYGGHTIPGYSLIYPPLGAWLGPVAVGALSAVAATVLFSALALREWGERAWLGVIWFGLASAAAPFAGRTTFALGLAIGLACLLAVQRGRPVLAFVAGAMTSLASPVAGLFAGLACAAVLAARYSPSEWIGRSSSRIVPALAGGLGASLALAALTLAFPTDGFQTFAVSAWAWIPLVVVALLILGGIDQPVLRWGAVLYLALSLTALIVETPLGGNVVRLGATFAGPLFAILLIGRRPVLLALLAVPLLWWQWSATVRDVASAEGDPATSEAYFQPALVGISRESSGEERVHVSPTRSRWESVYIAERFPIAGGWLRQLESDDFDFLEQEELDPGEYRDWLASKGASLVAVSDAEPDRLGDSERRLFDSGVFDSELVERRGQWRLYRFGPRPQRGYEPGRISGNARLLDVTPDGFFVRIGQGEAVFNLNYSPYMEITAGSGCVEETEDGLVRIISDVQGAQPSEPKTLRVQADLSLDAALGRDRHCAQLPSFDRFEGEQVGEPLDRRR